MPSFLHHTATLSQFSVQYKSPSLLSHPKTLARFSHLLSSLSLTRFHPAMAASSFSVASFTPKTLSITKPKMLASSLAYFYIPSFKSSTLSISIPISKRFEAALSSRFVRKVSVSAEFGQEEGLSDGGDEPSFSPDLKLFVGNLPFTVDSSQLAGLFESAGNVEMVEVIYDKMTGRSRGFGFVTMSTAEEVETAARQFNGYELDGRPLRVNAGPPPPRREREGSSFRGGPRGGSSFDNGNRIHVGNLSWGVDDLALKTLFSEQGEVLDAKVIYDRDSGRSKGFGFVTYGSAEEMNSAIESLDGADLGGRSIRVSAAEARPPRRQF